MTPYHIVQAGLGDTFFQSVIDALKMFWDWFLTVIWGFGDVVIGWIFALIPTSMNGQMTSSWNQISVAIDAANQWVPVSECITLCSMYVTFVLSYTAVKVVLKMIP